MATENYGYTPPNEQEAGQDVFNNVTTHPVTNSYQALKHYSYISYEENNSRDEVNSSVSVSIHIDDPTDATDAKMLQVFETIVETAIGQTL